MKLLCATGNVDKFELGKHALAKHGFELEQIVLDIPEIQSEDTDEIVRDKAEKAFELAGAPVVVTDDSWGITALRGFPGAYMKSMNHWLEPADFMRLMSGVEDRSIVLYQYVCYYDGVKHNIFRSDIPGEIVMEPRGEYGPSVMKIVSLRGDADRTISEVYSTGKQHEPTRLEQYTKCWDALGAWLAEAKT